MFDLQGKAGFSDREVFKILDGVIKNGLGKTPEFSGLGLSAKDFSFQGLSVIDEGTRLKFSVELSDNMLTSGIYLGYSAGSGRVLKGFDVVELWVFVLLEDIFEYSEDIFKSGTVIVNLDMDLGFADFGILDLDSIKGVNGSYR